MARIRSSRIPRPFGNPGAGPCVLWVPWLMYPLAVIRRTTIEMDDALLAEARSVLGTRGLKETVDRALTEVVRASRRRALASRLASGAGLDFDDETTRAARQWRVPESS